MKLEHLFEMPQQVNDTSFGLEDRHKNHLVAIELVERQDKKLLKKVSKTVHLYEISNQVILADMTHEREQILYLVEYEIENIKLINSNALTQIAVWRNFLRKETQNLAKKIFFNILLPKTNVIMTDSKQTWKGERFWGNRLIDAFGMGLNIYYIQFNQSPMVIQVPSAQMLDEFAQKYNPWGKGAQFRGRKFIITNKTFKEVKQLTV